MLFLAGNKHLCKRVQQNAIDYSGGGRHEAVSITANIRKVAVRVHSCVRDGSLERWLAGTRGSMHYRCRRAVSGDNLDSW